MADALPSIPAADDEYDVPLARRIAAGDRLAFELLMRRHNRRLFRLARAILRNDAEAEDALQEAYLAAYRSMGQFRGDATLGTWLSRLVLNQCFGRMRRQARRDNVLPMRSLESEADVETISQPGMDSPETRAMRAELRTLLERKLDALPEAYRLVFVLRCVEEMSVEETARSLDIPDATVRSRLFRARKWLQDALSREFGEVEWEIYEFGGRHCDRVVAGVLDRLRDEAGARSPGESSESNGSR